MDYSVEWEEAIRTLVNDQDEWVKDLKDTYASSIDRQKMYQGFYKRKYMGILKMRMKEEIRFMLSKRLNLNIDKTMELVCQPGVSDLIEDIIERSMYDV